MRFRVLSRRTVFFVVVLSAAWFASATWARLSGESPLAWETPSLILVGGFIPATFAGFRLRHPLLRAFVVLSSVAVGILNYALLAAAACWLAAGAAALMGLPFDRREAAFVLFGAAAGTAAYGMANAAVLRVTRVTIRLAGLPPEWEGRSIALVSDVHLGNIHGLGFVRRIVARLNALGPQAVFVAGDMFDGAKLDLERAARPWSDLKAPAGAYFVSGNHDEFSERSPFLAAIERAGLRVLHNEKVTVRGLEVIGILDGETQDPAEFRALLRSAAIDRDRPCILLAHRPTNLPIPAEEGVALQLSGHTHGGQFWPWTHVVDRVYGHFAHGLSRIDGLQVFTSFGAGTWGPPMRVGTRSEIVLLRLEASGAGRPKAV